MWGIKQPAIDHVFRVAKVLCHYKVDENESVDGIKMLKKNYNELGCDRLIYACLSNVDIILSIWRFFRFFFL